MIMTQRYENQNKYSLNGEYGVGYTLNTNEPFYFDLEDYDKIKNYRWMSKRRNNRKDYYIEHRFNSNSRPYLHNLIMNNIDKKNIIDHKNLIKYDCQKENLRISTNRQNAMNKNKQSNNSSGIIGVNYFSRDNIWVARINIDRNKRISIYRGKEKEEAIKARLQAELKYYGKDFAPQRHLFEKYDIR